MSVRYGTLTVLGDFDFVAPERTVTAVIGPNGSGKTTFLNALTGAVPYQTGRVTFSVPRSSGRHPASCIEWA